MSPPVPSVSDVSGNWSLGNDAPIVFPPGKTMVTWRAQDGSGNAGTGTTEVWVVDSVPPEVLNVSATPSSLWPPDHEMVEVAISAVLSDACVGTTSCIVETVTPNEPADGRGDGSMEPDWQIVGPMAVQLRAERSGTGDGRVYDLTGTCTDAADNATRFTVTVRVAHDQGSP